MQKNIKKFFKNKNILITGGTGSLKSDYRIFIKDRSEKIVIFSRDELKQYHMQKDINDKRLRYFIGDIRDRDRLNLALEELILLFMLQHLNMCLKQSLILQSSLKQIFLEVKMLFMQL